MRSFNNITADLVRGTILSLLIVILFSFVSYSETHYLREGVVTSVSDGYVVVEDSTGNIWEYKGTATIGQQVSMRMMNNHTDNELHDDVIVSVKSIN